ncbi:MAG: hypothetical protein HRT38_15510 [Alteromonadaceae bacterium]|nr:hypothetical protein [Alteromonadaceae bacterium]
MPVKAEGFTNKQFSQLTNDQKKHWLRSALDTLGIVANLYDEKIGACVFNWYATDTSAKNGMIEHFLKRNPDRMPSVILIVLTEDACGAYVRNHKKP